MPSKFIDFQTLKTEISIEQAVGLLGLQLKLQGAQLRGSCPACKTGGDRALVVTPAKSAFYCFAAGQGGDVIALAGHIKAIGMKDAAAFLAAAIAKPDAPALGTGAETVPATVPEKKKAGLNPLTYLLPEHPGVQALGVSPETARRFGAGYAPKGIMRGRLAIPIHDNHGQLLAYCGRTLKDESPALIFPNGFQPREVIFNGYRARTGPLNLVRDPLQVLTAFEGGIENVIAFLTESASPQQLEMLASLMDERHCETVELF